MKRLNRIQNYGIFNKKIRRGFILLLLLFTICMQPISASAEVPYVTWTQGPNGWMTDTQTAYIPNKVYQMGLNNPEDLFVAEDDTIYICDTGNSRIVILDSNGGIKEIKGEPLIKPTGIFVTQEYIYVADYGSSQILVYNKDGSIYTSFGRPDEPLFGDKTKFLPRKLAVDPRGNIYVVSEGSISGLMQFNVKGTFLGYFGSNQTNTSFKMILQKTFFTEEQMDKLFKNTPPSVANVSIDAQGLIYTVTKADIDNPIKKLSISGVNLFPESLAAQYQIADATVDKNGNVYTVSGYGAIFEYDSYGELLFAFGEKDNDMERMGLLSMPVAIDVTSDGRILILDQAKGFIQEYKPTQFAITVHEGIRLYKAGLYEQSEDIWKDIKKMNSSFILAYDALAKASFKKQDYADALYNYKIAENKGGYSQTYWEYRNQWLQSNLGVVILVLFGLMVLWIILKKIDKKKGIFQPIKNAKNKLFSIPIIAQITFGKHLFKHPVDAYYDMKYKKKINVASATFWYIWLIVLQITGIFVTGYVFNNRIPQYAKLSQEILVILVPVFLWLICNYLVSTITDGKGKFKDIYCNTIYALTPYLWFALPLQIVSNVLTLNEGFVYSYGFMVLFIWSAILFFTMVKEIHEYSFKQTVKNLLITIFTILLFVLIAFILYLLFKQMKDFFISVVKEVSLRG